jgi:diacylglycerol kinase family enzyme
MKMTNQVLVIYNPSLKSQVHTEEWMGQLVRELNHSEQYLVTFFPTTPETTAADIVPLLELPLKLVIAAGGDGTIRFALAALAMARSPIPVALFPIGTGNVLARNLGIVDHELLADPLAHAYDYISNGVPMRIDMGMMNGEFFA